MGEIERKSCAVNYQKESFAEKLEKQEITKVSDLEKKIGSKQPVSLEVFIQCEDYPVIPSLLPYRKDPIDKKECKGNDETGVIKIALWGQLVSQVSKNGVYTLKNAVVKRDFRSNELYVTTNTSTIISSSTKNIDATVMDLGGLTRRNFKFPSTNVRKVTVLYHCSTCKKNKLNVSKKDALFVCESCGSIKMIDQVKRNVQSKIDFVQEDGKTTVVNVYGPQIDQFFMLKGQEVPLNEEDIAFEGTSCPFSMKNYL